jgi:undecaprenyl-diphosphatase
MDPQLFKLIQTLFLALLQGVTELFPISSLGHTVILPSLFHWDNLVNDPAYLPLIVALHLGTSIALLLYFWRDWLQVGKTAVNSVRIGKVRPGTEEWVSWLIVVGCVPAGVIGVVLQSKIQALFQSPLLVASVLVLNGSLLFLGEALRRRAEYKVRMLPPAEREKHFRPLASLSWKEAVAVGLMQSLALIPGFSRSGSTLVGGLAVRLTHEDAARFSFLLGTPIIFAAALLKVPDLFHQNSFPFWMILLGMVVSGVAAFLSTKFLMKYFETGRLTPFAVYCWIFGLFAVGVFFVRHQW